MQSHDEEGLEAPAGDLGYQLWDDSTPAAPDDDDDDNDNDDDNDDDANGDALSGGDEDMQTGAEDEEGNGSFHGDGTTTSATTTISDEAVPSPSHEFPTFGSAAAGSFSAFDNTDTGNWSQGTFDDDGFADLPAEAFVSAPPATAGENSDWANFDDVPVPPAATALSQDQVLLIKNTMAAVDITPPPWVRKMQQVQAIQMHLEQQQQHQVPSEASGSDPPTAASLSGALTAEWAHQLHSRLQAPGGGHRLPAATLVGSSPLLATPTSGAASVSSLPVAAPAVPQHGLTGAFAALGPLGSARKKKVTGKQLVAENRRLREEAKRAAAARAGEA